jgi:hypothetical protein
VSFHLGCDHPEIKVVGGWHPSHQNIFPILGENGEAFAKKLTAAVFLLTAGDDNANVKPGGEYEAWLKSRAGHQHLLLHEFPDMKHGWVSRGDAADEKIARDYKEAMRLSTQFFQSHL